MTDKFKASIAGIEFDAADLSDTLSSSVVRHEYPYRNGALLEHLGAKARTIRIRAFFINDDYDRHQDLLSLLAIAEPYELVHPKYGSMMGLAEQVAVRHDDRLLTAEIDISFVEDAIGSTAVSVAPPDVVALTGESYLAGIASQLAELSQDIADDIAALTNAVDLRGYNSQMNACINAIGGMLVSIEQPANSLLSTIAFTVDTPGRLLSALSHTVERYSTLLGSLLTAPARFVSSFRNGMLELVAALGSGFTPARRIAISTASKHIAISGALRLGLDLARGYKADDAARKAGKRSESAKSFDAAGNYLYPIAPDPVMTVSEIEQSLSDARTDIQAAVATTRNLRELQDMAAALLSHVNRIKLEREKLAQITIDGTLPLHLIMLKRGLPYQAAERIHAINNFVNPNFVTGDIDIYVS